jgi:hypothetical protein
MTQSSAAITARGILSTLVPADAGTIRVAGHDLATDPDEVRAAERRRVAEGMSR